MVYRVHRTVACRQDLEVIFDHLVESYEGFGDSVEEALDHAEARLARIEDGLDALGSAPHQGTLWPEVMDGLRWTTKDRAVFYFVGDDVEEALSVLAVFFGAQNNKDLIVHRILP